MARKSVVQIYFMNNTKGYFLKYDDNGEIIITKDWKNAWSTSDDEEALSLREELIRNDKICTVDCEPKRFK